MGLILEVENPVHSLVALQRLQPPTGYGPSNNRHGRRGAGLDFYFLEAMRGGSDPEVLLQSLDGTQLTSYS